MLLNVGGWCRSDDLRIFVPFFLTNLESRNLFLLGRFHTSLGSSAWSMDLADEKRDVRSASSRSLSEARTVTADCV